MFEIKDKDLAGRIGIITTKHGKIETPYLFPVINPRKQEVPLDTIRDIGFTAVITNAWLVNRYYNGEAIEKKIHGLLNFAGPIMTDSGAYQELHYGYVEADPIDIVRFQVDIGSDIAVILDKPTPSDASFAEALESVEETYRRALEVISIIEKSDNLWVYPIQGAPYINAIKRAVHHGINSRIYNNFSLYAIGSPTKLLERYDYAAIVRIVAEAKMGLPPDKPVHLFGAGHPMIIPFMVALGIDTFDSASYILYARDERLMTSRGTIRLQELDYLPCICPICSKHTVKELKEMNRKERVRLIAQHNLYIILQEIRATKQAIREGRLWELLEERARSHPSLYDAFRILVKYNRYLEKMAPSFKPLSRGIFLYDAFSTNRPHILRHREKIMETYKPYRSKIVFLPLDSQIKKSMTIYVKDMVRKIIDVSEDKNGYEIVFYLPYFNIIPYDIIDVYPLFQFEMPKNPPREVIEEIPKYLHVFLKKLDNQSGKSLFKIYLVSNRNIEWSINTVEVLRSYINSREFSNLVINILVF